MPMRAADPVGTVGHELLVHPAGPEAPDGALFRVTPATAGWEYLSFATYRLSPGGSVARAGDGQEVLVLVLEGHVTVTVGERAFPGLGSRESVFDGPPPPLVLVEPDRPVTVRTDSQALVAVASAPAGDVRSTRSIDAGEIDTETRGTGRTERRIHHLLGPRAVAGRLIAFEVFTPGGNWSSYPPHKHDTDDPPRESRLEELYYYRFARPAGFAFQRVYTADASLDELVAARDHDVVLVPKGYHVVGAAPGYDCYYLNVMAGPTREWRFTVDPDHAWLMNWDPARPTR
jgi:5-deoxy-glucuronate isomerase